MVLDTAALTGASPKFVIWRVSWTTPNRCLGNPDFFLAFRLDGGLLIGARRTHTRRPSMRDGVALAVQLADQLAAVENLDRPAFGVHEPAVRIDADGIVDRVGDVGGVYRPARHLG